MHLKLKSGFPIPKMELWKPQELQISHYNNDRIDFRNSDVDVITTHFKDIRENNDGKML